MVEPVDFGRSRTVDSGTSETVGYCRPWRSQDTGRTVVSR
jgi:hypothetical protein